MENILSVKESRSVDEIAIKKTGIPSVVLMENAARGVFDRIKDLNKEKYIIFCGKGNNGGDGYALSRHLFKNGSDVKVYYTETPVSKDAVLNLNIAKKLGVQIKKADKDLFMQGICNTVIVDAIFGTGLSSEIKGPEKKIIKKINFEKGKDNIIVSIDIPSGLCADTGNILGICVEADIVVTLGAYKRGFFQNHGQEFLKNTVIEDLTIPKGNISSSIHTFDRPVLKKRKRYAHKHSYGCLAVIGGSKDYPHAPAIASYAALKSGCGMVYQITPQDVTVKTLSPEIIERKFPSKSGYFNEKIDKENLDILKKMDVIVLGCGLSEFPGRKDLIKKLLENFQGSLIADADSIPDVFNVLKNAGSKNVLLTPHRGEFEKLHRKKHADIFKSLHEFSRYGFPLLLKDGCVCYFSYSDQVNVSSTADPWMLKAGMGDALSGAIGSFISQGYPLIESVNLASYLTGRTAEILVEKGKKLTINALDIINNFDLASKEL